MLTDIIYYTGIAITILIIVIILTLIMPTHKVYFKLTDFSPELVDIFCEENNEDMSDVVYNKLESLNLSLDISMKDIPDKTTIQSYSLDISTLPIYDQLLNSETLLRYCNLIYIVGGIIYNSSTFSETNKIANDTIGIIVPINVPGKMQAGIWCDGETKYFEQYTPLLYDLSVQQYYFNKNSRYPIVLLLFYMSRGEYLSMGISTQTKATLYM